MPDTRFTIRTVHRMTSNGMPYVGKIYERPGFSAAVVVGDIESLGIQADDRMTFHPKEVREITAALSELANWMDGLCTCGHPAHDDECGHPITEDIRVGRGKYDRVGYVWGAEIVDTCRCTGTDHA